MTTYEMTTIDNGTRIRELPNTGGKELTRVDANVKLAGSELFTASVPLSNSAGIYQFVGDKWLKVSYNGVTGWMAYIHKGEPICKDFRVVTDTTPTDPPSEPVQNFPESFILTDPQGNRAEYVLVKVL